MVEQGANVLDAAADGQTPLTMAVKSGSFQVVKMVIDRMKALAAPRRGLAQAASRHLWQEPHRREKPPAADAERLGPHREESGRAGSPRALRRGLPGIVSFCLADQLNKCFYLN
ncbi:hypothetical protein [Hydrogenophaga sp.]|jgi:hypothetical protein|uniref:hypothetical protein n=1 Tax=Hydrogenophaga sp. TaxID=1904254 RepID=UPI00352337BE